MSNDFEFEFEDYDPLEAKPITKKKTLITDIFGAPKNFKCCLVRTPNVFCQNEVWLKIFEFFQNKPKIV